MTELSPALFLDRDGVVNSEIGYLYLPSQVRFIPGIFDLVRAARSLGSKIIIVTNQAGIARELYSEEDFHSLMRWMTGEFTREGAPLDGYYFCPHHPEYAIDRYRMDCPDRKPRPGMILRAARDHRIDLARSVLIGDRCSDLQAGSAAGIRQLLLLAGTEPSNCSLAIPYKVVTSLAAAEASLYIGCESRCGSRQGSGGKRS